MLRPSPPPEVQTSCVFQTSLQGFEEGSNSPYERQGLAHKQSPSAHRVRSSLTVARSFSFGDLSRSTLTRSNCGLDSSSLYLRPLKMTRLAGPPTRSRPCSGSFIASAGMEVTAAGQAP